MPSHIASSSSQCSSSSSSSGRSVHFDATADKGRHAKRAASVDKHASSLKPVTPTKNRGSPAKSALKNGSTSSLVQTPQPSEARSSSSSSPSEALDAKTRPGQPSPIIFDGCSHDCLGLHHSFSNLAPYPVEYDGKVYPTSEHLFQTFKFLRRYPQLAEHIRTISPNGKDAFWEARHYQPYVRQDWMSGVNVTKMELTLYLKFTQHPALATELLATGFRELVETSPNNGFWGIGTDGQGRNELGKALMRVRSRLREERSRTQTQCATCRVRLQTSKSGYCASCERIELCQTCHIAPQKDGKPYCSSQCAKRVPCGFCHSCPQRMINAPYCSRECATRVLCRQCGIQPRVPGRKYCSRECERGRRNAAA